MKIRKLKSVVSTVLCSALGMMLGYWIAANIKMGIPNAEVGLGKAGEVLSARSLELVDVAGRRRILMALTDSGTPAIWFFDRNGKSRLNLGLYEDNNPFIVLNDANAQAVQILRTVGDKSAPVLVMKSKGQDRTVLGLNFGSAPDPFFVYYDAQGTKKTVYGNFQT